jgi:hypothetical protein
MFFAGTLVNAPAQAQAEEESLFNGPGHWRLVVSPFSYHFNPSPEHEYVWAVGAERQSDNGWLYGGSFFSNSFGQPSAYAYVGQRYGGLLDQPPLYFQWSAGLLYGYVGQYKNKVPLNYNGFSPAVNVALAYQFTPTWGGQLMIGGSFLMFMINMRIP